MQEYFKGFTLYRITESGNSFGGGGGSRSEVGEYDGVIDMLSGDEAIKAQQVAENSTHILLCDLIDIRHQDEIEHAGKVYRVRYVDNPMGLDSHLECMLEYIGVVSDE